jgi:hypothetical protein
MHNRKQKMKSKLELLESEIFYLRGSKRIEARNEYFRLLKSCGKEYGLDEPIYIMRC